MTTLKDPVCGMKVTRAVEAPRCARRTRLLFLQRRLRVEVLGGSRQSIWTRAPAPVAVAAEPGAIYTCPMHPQIRQVGPGQLPDLRHGARTGRCIGRHDDTELRTMTRRLWISAALSLPIALIAMSEFAPALHQQLIDAMGAWFGWTQFLLGDAGRAVVRSVFLQARLAIDRQSLAEHVHVDCARRRSGLWLQRLRAVVSAAAACSLHDEWRAAAVLRSGGDHHDAW